MAMEKTSQQFEQWIAQCKALFMAKAQDYGTSWSILRLSSLTDQINIKALRIRSIQESGVNLVGDSVEGEFVGIINYCVIALMLWERAEKDRPIPASLEVLDTRYDEAVDLAMDTLNQKNHDYGEAWRKMRVSSITDLILMKILRLKQIEDNAGETKVSEGVDANYIDILNYAIFALVLMEGSNG